MAAGLGTRIKRARERKRWTQKELADALEVNIKTVDNWENGRTSPRSSIGALEAVLGVSLAAEPGPAEPPISPELRTMIDALNPEQRAWVREQLEQADRRLRRREGDPEPDAPARPRREAAG